MSVFTYDPDPPRVLSPWSRSAQSQVLGTPTTSNADRYNNASSLGGLPLAALTRLEDHGLAYLDAEPETGPVEYKLHLLLRQRQQFAYTSTGEPNTDPRAHRRHNGTTALGTAVDSTTVAHGYAYRVGARKSATTDAPSQHSRQNRLRSLTTQLLWSLQQSSPYHASSTADLVIPNLPDASKGRLGAPTRPGNLLPGIEESQGAMYEIGVNDDGALIGLTREEMSESLINLRAMAASLGCNVSILRAIVVGACKIAPTMINSSSAPSPGSNRASGHGRTSAAATNLQDLIVVEALVLPDTSFHASGQLHQTPLDSRAVCPRDDDHAGRAVQETEQLRVSLTGSTTSGKSSLLGTLLASTLDNARGKSRLNLLKHRHEIASGVTSSVAHELLGYESDANRVVNYACDNVDSWTDVHNMAEGGRLVLLTDSAGHPRFRRTIVRSLVAWQPHWTLCCIAAAYAQESSSSPSPSLSQSAPRYDDGDHSVGQALAIAHLELCLKLDLSLVVVITKYDLATRQGLRSTLSRILDTLKAAGRAPSLLKPSEAVSYDEELQWLPDHEMEEVATVLASAQASADSVVPIVLTSAVTGAGMTKLHSLLRHLPIRPDAEGIDDVQDGRSRLSTLTGPTILFDVDEIFVKQGHSKAQPDLTPTVEQTFVLSGLLRRGSLTIGTEMLLGPFSDSFWTSEPRPPLDGRRAASYPVTDHEIAMRRASRFGPRRRRSSEDFAGERPAIKSEDTEVADAVTPEWYKMRVVSLRNLRLPVQTGFQNQAITVGVVFTDDAAPGLRPRKGMVLADDLTLKPSVTGEPTAASCHAFQALFDMDAYSVMEPGARFFIYIASVRAQAKVVTVGSLVVTNSDPNGSAGHADDLFQLDGAADASDRNGHGADQEGEGKKKIEVMFQLLSSREYIEIGAKTLVMPEQAGEAGTGLDGYVGAVSAVYA